MLNIRECLNERIKYPLRKSNDDAWVQAINEDELRKEVFFVVPEGFLFTMHNKQRELFEQRYSIAGVYDMGSPYENTGVRMVLVHAVSNPIKYMKVGIFGGPCRARAGAKEYMLNTCVVSDAYTVVFLEYIKIIESWINNDTSPKDNAYKAYEFNSIPIELIDPLKKYPSYYSKGAAETRRVLQEEKTVALSDVADILVCKEVGKECGEVKRLRVADCHYPFKIEDVKFEKKTSLVVEYGDIVYPTVGNAGPYLYVNVNEEKIYASPHMVVIRCKKISPYYLYIYLLSDTAKNILDSIRVGVSIQRIKAKDLSDVPIVLPTMDDDKYRFDFEVLTSNLVRKYRELKPEQEKRFKEYFTKLNNIASGNENAEHIEDILNMEVAAKLKVHNEEQLRSFLTDDLEELNACYKAKAYKATLILAGSILEAVLIDWLSEIHNKDYFENEYIIVDRRTGREKRADLVDYINEIKYIERPRWMEEASKAHEIRKKRNLVHAKLCLKSNEINAEVCKQVVQYLKDVLKTRGFEE